MFATVIEVKEKSLIIETEDQTQHLINRNHPDYRLLENYFMEETYFEFNLKNQRVENGLFKNEGSEDYDLPDEMIE